MPVSTTAPARLRRILPFIGFGALAAGLAGCVQGPPLLVMPGPNKSYDAFRQDDAACRAALAPPAAPAADPNLAYVQCMAARGNTPTAPPPPPPVYYGGAYPGYYAYGAPYYGGAALGDPFFGGPYFGDPFFADPFFGGVGFGFGFGGGYGWGRGYGPRGYSPYGHGYGPYGHGFGPGRGGPEAGLSRVFHPAPGGRPLGGFRR